MNELTFTVTIKTTKDGLSYDEVEQLESWIMDRLQSVDHELVSDVDVSVD